MFPTFTLLLSKVTHRAEMLRYGEKLTVYNEAKQALSPYEQDYERSVKWYGIKTWNYAPTLRATLM
jgi:hypothetical protein